MNTMLEQLGIRAKAAESSMRLLSTDKKNQVLRAVAKSLTDNADRILVANGQDIAHGKENHMSQGLLDRLLLTKERIEGMAERSSAAGGA